MSQSRELNPLWKVWDDSLKVNFDDGTNSIKINSNNTYKLVGTEWTFRGFSIAALRTNFIIKELNIMLDAGLSGNMTPDHIFITHCHSDHCANLPFHIYSSKENSKINIYVPFESVDNIHKYIKSAHIMSCEMGIANALDSFQMNSIQAGIQA